MVSKKRGVKKTSSEMKRDLEIFEKGVERLKELDRELKSLDTRGFYREEQSIRSKLKNVSDIPLIEKEIKTLRLKINRKYKPKIKKNSSYDKIQKEIKGVEEELPTIERNIRVLNNNLNNMSKKKTGKIDLGVGTLVDNDFNDFLGDIKLTLSDRIRKRESEIKNILDVDLKKRNLDFRKKHRKLIEDFNSKKKKLYEDFEKKYNDKIKSSLKKKVDSEFGKQLNSKLEVEKNSLAKKYQEVLNSRVSEHLKKDRKKLRKKLLKELSSKIASLEKEFDRKTFNFENDLKKNYADKLKVVEQRRKEMKIRALEFDIERKRKEAELVRLNKVGKEKILAQKEHAMKLVEQRMKLEKLAEEKVRKLDNERKVLDREEKKSKEREKKRFGIIKSVLEKRDAKKMKRLENKESLKMKELTDKMNLLDRERKEHEGVLAFEKVKLDEQIRKNNLRLAEEKKKLREDLQKHSEKLAEKKRDVELERMRFEKSRDLEISKIREDLSRKISLDLEKKLADKEKLIRAQMKSEYDLALKKKIEERDEELKKKKLELEMEIQRKMREALG